MQRDPRRRPSELAVHAGQAHRCTYLSLLPPHYVCSVADNNVLPQFVTFVDPAAALSFSGSCRTRAWR